MTFLLIFEESTQVMKSSMFLVTRKAGSVTASGPTRTCPCSMYVTASLRCSANLSFTITVASLRLQELSKQGKWNCTCHIVSYLFYLTIKAASKVNNMIYSTKELQTLAKKEHLSWSEMARTQHPIKENKRARLLGRRGRGRGRKRPAEGAHWKFLTL